MCNSKHGHLGCECIFNEIFLDWPMATEGWARGNLLLNSVIGWPLCYLGHERALNIFKILFKRGQIKWTASLEIEESKAFAICSCNGHSDASVAPPHPTWEVFP